MTLSVQDLITPRYKVVADYPDSILSVGYIFETYDNGIKYVTLTTKVDVRDFPHLFKPLQWWEERSESEMPEYVKWKDKRGTEKIVKVAKWEDDGDNELFFTWDEDPHPKKIGYYPRSIDALPATETEYNDYLQSLKQKQ